MELHLEQIRDQQKDSWNKFSNGWKKWDEMMMDFLGPMGKEIIRLVQPAGRDLVLDVASGTGEPGLSIAAMLDGGKVVSADISEGMLEVALENAASRNLNNFETRVCDVSELPFEDNRFDVVTCRFGFMFFPDMLQAAKEMARVLKPGGRIATSVWNIPEKNFWVTAISSIINKNMELPPPPPGAPGMFRCAKTGLIADLFRQAGLKNILESEINSKLQCGTANVYWDLMTEVAAPFVAALSKADDAMKATIKAEVLELVNQKYPASEIAIDASALVIYGEK